MTDAGRATKGDLAALAFRAHDGLRQAISWIEGRTFQEDDTIVIVTRARVTRTNGGALIFGDVQTAAAPDAQ